MAALSMVGGGWGAFSILPLFFPARTRRFALAFALTLGVDALLVYGLKAAVARPRPWLVLPDIQPVFLPGPSDFSFPSGHAAGSFCYAVFITVVLVKTRKGAHPILVSAILLFLALGVALSRVALGVHFPADVTAGAIIGATVGAIGANLYLRQLVRRTMGKATIETAAPEPTPPADPS